jgi:hypothetical protein
MRKLIAVVCCIGLIVPLAVRAEGPYGSIYDTLRSRESGYDWTFSASATFITGELATAVTSSGVYVPFTLQRNLSRGRVALTLPYIGERIGIDTSDFEGRYYQTGRTGSSGYYDSGGLSDMILKGGYDFQLEKNGYSYDLTGVARVKFPTARRSRGLGSGESDQSVGLEALKTLEDNWFTMGSLYFTNTGDMPNNELQNPFSLAFGVGYKWPETGYLSVQLEQSSALLDGHPHPRDFLFNYAHPINEDTDLVGHLLWGLSEGSADFAIGIGVNVRFE